MATIYRVVKWREIYETADSRKHKRLSWVSMPIDRQSSGYQSLIEQFPDNAPAIYGAWCALVSVAAECPERGLLASSRGVGYTADRIARLAFMPVEPFQEMLDWASSESVGWLEVVTPEELSAERQSINDQSPIDQQSINDKSNSALPNLTRPNQTIHGRQSTVDDSTFDDAAASVVGQPDPAKVKRFGNKIGRACSRKDQVLAWKLVALEQVLGEAWLANIAAAVEAVKPEKPWAYAWTVAAKGCHERAGPGEDKLKRLLARAPEPPPDWPQKKEQAA